MIEFFILKLEEAHCSLLKDLNFVLLKLLINWLQKSLAKYRPPYATLWNLKSEVKWSLKLQFLPQWLSGLWDVPLRFLQSHRQRRQWRIGSPRAPAWLSALGSGVAPCLGLESSSDRPKLEDTTYFDPYCNTFIIIIMFIYSYWIFWDILLVWCHHGCISFYLSFLTLDRASVRLPTDKSSDVTLCLLLRPDHLLLQLSEAMDTNENGKIDAGPSSTTPSSKSLEIMSKGIQV